MKKSYWIPATLTFLIVTGIYLSGCNKNNEPVVTEFTIKVDSIHHADTISVGDTFQVDFFAKIGDNDCYEFLRFEPTFDVNLIEVKLVGKHTARGDCIDGIQYMNPASVKFTDLTAGKWNLRVMQPEGTTPIESIVIVE